MMSGYSFGRSIKTSSTFLFSVVVFSILIPFVVLIGIDSQASCVQTSAGQAIYADDPNDAWNRIFRSLFSRTFKAHLSTDFTSAAPFSQIQYSQFPHDLLVSKGLFERAEIGDRAIEPLYPSFFTSEGVAQVLAEPLYSQLKQALTEALEEERERPALDRALMQSDSWAAYDVLFGYPDRGSNSQQSYGRREQLLLLLARFIKKLALTPSEMERLPDNYTAAAGNYALPKLFVKDSGWLEVEWRPDREHDHSMNYRRATRIFLKPISTPSDMQEFLNSLRAAPNITSKLEAVLLVTQNLLIDREGKVVPSRLVYDVQLRRFNKSDGGTSVRTEIEEYELSRRLLLKNPAAGGLNALDDRAPAYLPEAGNDYGYASIHRNQRGDGRPILATLRSRCIACHGPDIAAVFTFSSQSPPTSLPPVTQLNPLANEHALFVARRKMDREDFKALDEQDRR